MTLRAPQVDTILLAGGLDMITPTLSLKNGFVRQALNFECGVSGGYTRIAGYERFDGHTSPTTASNSSDFKFLSFTSITGVVAVGNTLVSSSGATGIAVYVFGKTVAITKVTGTWAVNNTVTIGGTLVGSISDPEGSAPTPLIAALVRNGIADVYRAGILSVPGSGSILGVVKLNDIIFAFRNAVGGASTNCYKSSAAGWVQVTLGVTLSPNGRYEFCVHNFLGQATSTKIYGCDGVNKAFQFDGTTFTQLSTGATTDTPTHVAAHKGRLYLAQGSSVMWSKAGDPTIWTGVSGAGEYASGDTVTGIMSMPGGTTAATLGVFSRNRISILYGDPADTAFNAVPFYNGSGCLPGALQNMAQTFAFDDRGLMGVTTAQEYGNFVSTSLTAAVLPFINSRVNLMTASALNRRKSQYRAFYSDGWGLYVTVVNGKLSGSMPVYFPDPVTCTYEGKTSTGVDVNYFGSTNGMVYQLDQGTSFDGAVIDYELQLNYSNARGPRTIKRYRKASIEILSDTPAYAEFSVGYSLGYESEEYAQPINTAVNQYLGTSRWDQFTWDQFFWDTNSLEPVNAELDGTAENIAMAITGSSDYVQPFTVNSILIHYSPRRMMR